MKSPVQFPTTHTPLLAAFRDFLLTLGLSASSRKLYLADILRFLRTLSPENLTVSLLASPKTYLTYLTQPPFPASATLTRRTLASLRQFGAFLAQSYHLPNPTQSLTLAPNPTTLTLSPASNKYIKAYTEYLKENHLSSPSLRSYKSDLTQYLTYLESHHPSTPITTLLSEKNLQKYTDMLTHLATQSPATILRKTKTIKRFYAWLSLSQPQVQLSDNYDFPALNSQPALLSAPDPRPAANPATTSAPDLISLTTSPDQPTQFVKNGNYRKLRLPSLRTTLTFGLLLSLVSTLSILTYRQFGSDARLTAAFPSTPVTPNRQLSFQGRLENASGTPITSATNFVFKLYDASSGGTELYSSGTCSITPDTDGVFSTQIGSTCGSGIGSNVFTENANVYLDVTVGAETLTPRQQIATVAYALNSETIQGFPISATVSAVRNTVVPMNQWGEILVGEQSPRLRGVAGTFQVSAPALSLVTNTGTNGNISLAPDGTGSVNVTGNTTSTNFFNVSNAQLTTGSLITGTVANNNSGFKLLDLLSGSSPTSKFSVTDAGNTTLAGTLTLPNTNTLTGVASYLQLSQGLSVGGATTYYLNSSGTANLNGLTLAGTLDANGQVDLGDGGDTITLNGSSITLTGYNCSANSNGGALTTNGSGVLQCSDDDSSAGGASSRWQENLGTISPINGTWDVLVGGTATSSAKIGFININSGTPTINLANQASNIAVKDATANALQILEGANAYLALTTSNGTESLSFGNTTTNPSYNFLGSGTSTFSGPVTGTTATFTPTGNTTALTLTGTNVTSSNLAYLNARNTSGTILNQAYGSAATLAGTLTGYVLDLSTNVTNALRSVTGINLTLPTTTAASTTTHRGLTLSGGTFTNSSGTSIWTGLDVTTPTLVQSSGTLTGYGLKITNTNSLSGTVYGAYINSNGGNALALYDGASNNSLLVSAGGTLTTKATAFDSVQTCTGSANCTGAATDGGSFADNTTEAKLSGGTAFTMLATGTAANTSLYVGADHPFSTIHVTLATAGVGTTALTAQYWNGSAWTAVSGQSDRTNLGGTPLSQNGTITFTLPTAWATKSVNSSASLYFIRLVGTTDATTAPTASSLAPTTGYASSLYAQNNNPTPHFELDSTGYLTAPTLTKPLAFNRVYGCSASANCTGAATDGGSFVENTTEARTNGGTAFTLLSTGTAADTSTYVGSDRPFNSINVDIATADVGSTALHVEYWNGSAWTAVTNQADTTTSGGVPLSQDGLITFTPSSSWTAKSLNSSPSLYWIRIHGTTNATTAPTAYFLTPTTNTRLQVFGQAGDSVAALTVNDLGDLTLGTDNDIYPTLGPGSANLGSLSLAWDNIYGTNLYQNGNLVCDTSGANCPVGATVWRLASGALSPANDTLDLLIGGVATSSAKIGFININSGTPTINLANQASNIAVKDATANALQILEGANAYLALTTSNGTESLSFGNTTTNPSYNFLGSGTSTFSGPVTANGVFTLGDNGDVGSVNTSDWDVTTTGDMTGIGAITADGLLTLTNSATMSGTLTVGNGTTNNIRTPYGPLTLSYKSGADAWSTGFTLQDTTGNVGIGVTAPSQKLEVNGYIAAQRYVDSSTTTNYLDPADATTSLAIAGDILNTDAAAFSISSSSNNNITINAGSGTVEIGSGGAGKLDAGTIDPPYTINGKKFATYMASMTGVKEETTGLVTADEYIPGRGYRATLDFAASPEGSDLWLFSKTTDLKNNFNQLVILLSSSRNVRTWYTLDPVAGRAYLYSSSPATLSYRATAPRFDAELWSNTRAQGGAGHIINDTSDWDTAVVLDHAIDAADLQNATIVLEENSVKPRYSVFRDVANQLLDEVAVFKDAVIANLRTGQIETNRLQTDLITPLATDSALTLQAPVVITPPTEATESSEPLLLVEGELEATTVSARLAQLETLRAQEIVANNIVADTITANQIVGLDAKLATLSSSLSDEELSSITTRIKDRLANLLDPVTASDLPLPPESTAAANLPLPVPDLTPTALATVAADLDFVTINQYLAVIGHATITSLQVNDTLYASSINSYDNTLALLPTGGILNLASSTLIVDSSTGLVTVNGDLQVTGTIVAERGGLHQLDLGKPNDATTSSALGNLLAVYNESGETVATINASGSANLAGLTTQLITIASGAVASNSSELSSHTTSNATAGTSVLVAPNTEQIIYSPFVTPDSLVYLTPTTNTDNKVLFVKAKESCPSPASSPTQTPCKPSFTVGLDAAASSDISFNWWIIQLTQQPSEASL